MADHLLVFAEQMAALRKRLGNLVPSAKWTDMQKNAHDRAFTVAGAMKADLLADLAGAVGTALADPDGGIEGFRRDFDKIVAKHGWQYVGERNWRTRVIYKTNLLTSVAAGRLSQLRDPELLSVAPYWRYVHNDSVVTPRPNHKHWGDSNLTLKHDHPFWLTHYPPNGWGCHCRVTAVRKPAKGHATSPPEGWDTETKTGAPIGIDKGWAYMPGGSVSDELRSFTNEKASKLPTSLARDFLNEMNDEN